MGKRPSHSYFAKYLPECCSIPFRKYLAQLNLINHTTDSESYFNQFKFGTSSRELFQQMGKPSFSKKDKNVTMCLYKRKVSGLRFALTACFLNDELVYFQTECRESISGNQDTLLQTILKKYDCSLNQIHFPGHCALIVSKLFTVKVEFFSINRKHVRAMKEFGATLSAESAIEEIFDIKSSQLQQII